MAAYTTIDDPEAHFQVKTYSGTDAEQAYTLDGDTDMQPDLVWFKSRASVRNHALFDAVRGATKTLNTDQAQQEETYTNGLTSFDSDGFTVEEFNLGNGGEGQTYVAWCWKANGTGSSNTSGSINTTATSANTTSGFSIITYTGNGSDGATIGHGLGAIPGLIICKERSSDAAHTAFHHKNTSAPATDHLNISNTDATADNDDRMNDTMPTSTLITLGDSATVNGNTETYVNYVWTEIQGFSKFGSYTGNGNADGAFVYTGFRPATVIFKVTSATGSWLIVDNKRDPHNVANHILLPSGSDAAITGNSSLYVDFLSTGFKIRGTNSSWNGDGATYIYAAWAEVPFVNSNGVPCNAR